LEIGQEAEAFDFNFGAVFFGNFHFGHEGGGYWVLVLEVDYVIGLVDSYDSAVGVAFDVTNCEVVEGFVFRSI
jgi:hypothetical protein